MDAQSVVLIVAAVGIALVNLIAAVGTLVVSVITARRNQVKIEQVSQKIEEVVKIVSKPSSHDQVM